VLLAIVFVTLNALAQMAFLPAYPVGATVILVLDVVVLWALVVHGETGQVVSGGADGTRVEKALSSPAQGECPRKVPAPRVRSRYSDLGHPPGDVRPMRAGQTGSSSTLDQVRQKWRSMSTTRST
jgi:hypothetical protein